MNDSDVRRAGRRAGGIDLVVFGGVVVLAGRATRPANLRLAPGSFLVGVRFRPGAAPPLLGVGAADVRDLEVPVGEVWGRAGAAIAGRVLEAAGPGGASAEAGYADQAHLTRESRQLGGLPPAALLAWEAERLGEDAG